MGETRLKDGEKVEETAETARDDIQPSGDRGSGEIVAYVWGEAGLKHREQAEETAETAGDNL
jgi:hypothetical protein